MNVPVTPRFGGLKVYAVPNPQRPDDFSPDNALYKVELVDRPLNNGEQSSLAMDEVKIRVLNPPEGEDRVETMYRFSHKMIGEMSRQLAQGRFDTPVESVWQKIAGAIKEKTPQVALKTRTPSQEGYPKTVDGFTIEPPQPQVNMVEPNSLDIQRHMSRIVEFLESKSPSLSQDQPFPWHDIQGQRVMSLNSTGFAFPKKQSPQFMMFQLLSGM